MNIGSQARDVKDLFVIRDHVYVGDRHLRGGQSERQCSEGIAVTSNLPTMMARKGQNQSSSANLTLPQRVELEKNVPMRSPMTSGAGYEVAVETTLEATTFRIGGDQ
ncbi:hypothetical protein LF1_58440 [Rubripirellula obstinata]|uniref:Uncharacterized protein n=1 Tax=Rubripirellula obstinata TaxID=406547 RepID=A0A5B1C715_9BACT|nr:hypothetical protein [Rubripirellula obstinata]KAA1256867.1 hypothetical protein LF1_58440 [Rubripirellula obstinata]